MALRCRRLRPLTPNPSPQRARGEQCIAAAQSKDAARIALGSGRLRILARAGSPDTEGPRLTGNGTGQRMRENLAAVLADGSRSAAGSENDFSICLAR
jgi:hypothetical protein